jgi:mannosyl-oligosaccharide glucosidase
MEGYGWTVYDTRIGGSQTFHDAELHLDLTTGFLKSEDGSSWAARIVGTPKPGPSNVKTSVILHAALEKADSDELKHFVCEGQGKSNNGVYAICQGDIPAFDTFELQVLGDAKNKILRDTSVRSIRVPEEKIWQAKGVCSNPTWLEYLAGRC